MLLQDCHSVLGLFELLPILGLNEELVEIVVSRDELHMQQDSILVNIEDLQR